MSYNSASYTLCVSAFCPSCKRVIGLLQDMNVKVEIKDVQLEKNCQVSIIPALFKGNKLIAYGKDIVYYFKKRKKKR
jgi:glutaredoxin